MSETKQSVFGKGKFEESDENKFLNFSIEKDNNTLSFKFLENEPVVSMNKFGSEQYTFEVMEANEKKVMSHSITSKRYMRALDEISPLEGKTVCVHRIGAGMETDYTVIVIE